MYEALKNVRIPKGATKARTKTLFNKANAKIADVLNHTRNVSKKAQDSVKKFENELKEVEKEIKAKKKEGKSVKALQKRKDSLKNRIESKTDVMTVAIGTSLTNYIDPRLIVSWADKQDADLTAIYTAALLRKFTWAIKTTDKTWDWIDSPLIGNTELEPLDGEVTSVQISAEDKPPKKSRRRRSSKKVKPSKPTKEPSKPTKEPSKPTKEPSKPTKEPSKPTKEPSKPTKEPSKPTKEPSKPTKEPNITTPPNKTTSARPPVIHKHIGPGTVHDYELLLHLCEKPEKYKHKFINIPRNVLEWIYPFSQYAIKKGTGVKANKYIVQFYEAAYGT
jgi:hypothetical protein